MHMVGLDQVELPHVCGDRNVWRERLNAEDLECLRQERLDRRAGDRPAGVRHVGLGQEIIRLEDAAPASPMVGAAAEKAQPRNIEIEVGIADHLALVEILRFIAVVIAAGLEDDRRDASFAEHMGDRDAGRAGPDDADARRKAGRPKRFDAFENHRASRCLRSLRFNIQPSISTNSSAAA